MLMSFRMKVVRTFSSQHHMTTHQYSKTKKLVLGSLLGAIAAILQSAGLIAGIGYVFSMLATGPIVLATVLSARIGFLTYILTSLLLVIIQPTEVLIFLFTTGLLGVSLGMSFKFVKNSALVYLIAGACLTFGIAILLYVFQFPILGPSITTQVNGKVILGLLIFSVLYSAVWMKISVLGMKKLNKKMLRNVTFENQ